MRKTKRRTRTTRALALAASSLIAVALPVSPGYAGDSTDQARDHSHSVDGQLGQLRTMIQQRTHGQELRLQLNGSGNYGHVKCKNQVLDGVDVQSVTVPRGKICILVNSAVAGNVTVKKDAILGASNSRIGGNLVGYAHAVLQAEDNQIGGSVLMQKGRPAPDAFVEDLLCNNRIGGSTSLQRNTGFIAVGDPGLECGGNVVGGNLTATDNHTKKRDLFNVLNNLVGGNIQIIDNAGKGSKTVQNNVAGGKLSCFGNQSPFVGTPNTAAKLKGQCKW
ncbi:hypothetical protein [Actinopolymorpha rutila]|uniref:Right handed beta helix region n=1 Tax=Actinopolymorpha rutila TaxID=446787 RepID=A0A852ZRI6_9ACTN|nr:hypothetical protein [Actinopolymorpha rutila]NYH91196.1 hypothetical protein [Actinopolymorpha rutila]